MKFLLPPSSIFAKSTACAVVPEPAKKSNTLAFLFLWHLISVFINSTGLVYSKSSLSPNWAKSFLSMRSHHYAHL